MSEHQIFITEITDQKTITSAIEESCVKQCRVEVVVNEVKYITKFNGQFSLSFNEIEVASLEGVVFQENQKYKATIFGDNQVFGMVVEFKKTSPSGQVFSFPLKFFKINRREAFRFKIPAAYEINADLVIDNKAYKGKLLDVSLDGVGIFLEFEPDFKANEKAQQVYFKLDNKEIYSLGEVKVIFPTVHQKIKGFKIGIKLEKVNGQGQTHIMNYMNSKLSQYSKKMS